MKKRLILGLAALAAVTLTSCQKDQVINETPQQNAIEFGTYLGRDAQTKGSVLDNAVLQEKGFGVFGYYTDNSTYDQSSSALNYMNNQKVEWSNSIGWNYSPIKYWPNESSDKLTFFAYAPYQEGRKASASQVGDPILTINVDEDVTKHIDYTYATRDLGLINLTKQSVDGNINLKFQHAMSRVGFKVEAVIDEVNNQENNGVTDQDNESNGFNNAETTITVQEVELYAINKFYANAQLNLNGGNWNKDVDQRTVESYKLTNGQFTDIATGVTTSKEQLNDANNYIMMIPADLSAAGEQIKVRVKYTVTTIDTSLPSQKSEIINDITSDKFGFNFEQGKAYNFVLHLGLTSVKLSATVNDWDVATDHVVNVPLNF